MIEKTYEFSLKATVRKSARPRNKKTQEHRNIASPSPQLRGYDKNMTPWIITEARKTNNDR